MSNVCFCCAKAAPDSTLDSTSASSALLDPLHRRYRMLSPTRCSMPDTMCEKNKSANSREEERNRQDEQDGQDVGGIKKIALLNSLFTHLLFILFILFIL